RFAADGRPRAVSGDEKTRVQRVRITQPHINAAAIWRDVIVDRGAKREIRHRRGSQIDTKLARFGRERINKNPVLDHMREGFTRPTLGGKSEKGRPTRTATPAGGDRHIENWLGVGSDALPNAKRLEQPTHRGDDRGGAFVIGGRGTAKAGVRDDNDEAI